MIRNHEVLEIYMKQLNLAMGALVSLHKRVFAANPRNYAVFSESYIDVILQLRGEIDEFLKIKPSEPEAPATGNGADGTQAAEAAPAPTGPVIL